MKNIAVIKSFCVPNNEPHGFLNTGRNGVDVGCKIKYKYKRSYMCIKGSFFKL